MNRRTAEGSGGATFRPRWGCDVRLAIASICLLLAACGGGGGGQGAAGNADVPQLSVLKVTVTDTYGAKVEGATVQGPQNKANTDAQGLALVLLDATTTSASLTISRDTFIDESVVANVIPRQVNEIAVTIERARSPAGGSLASRSGFVPVANDGEQQLTFEIELVVVGVDSQPIVNLSATDFVLRVCSPDSTNDRIDCIQGSAADADQGYTPVTAVPQSLQLVPGQTASPYAAALLLDQSGSIIQSDPTGARLFSAKAFLSGLGTQDRALLAAFAGGPGALIPTTPLAVYAPFKDNASAQDYFPVLDSLAPLVGGNTPLYDSIDTLRTSFSDPSLPAGLAKAAVIFTDGADTTCVGAEACRTRREQSIQGANADSVRIFTIGLSSGVDILALGELANRTGGAMLYADTAEQLLPLYGSVGKLLSLSLPTYRLRYTVHAGSPGAFRSGNALLGRVHVTTGAGAFDVPFIVRVP
jgi:hypothetical protein